MIKLMTGTVLRCLAKLPDESVQCVVTSPPYWGLRDYGTAAWKGGDPDCDHVARQARHDLGRLSLDDRGGNINPAPVETPIKFRDLCRKCGARRIDAQIGLEPTPEAYVASMVAVFREVWRVLRPDGTCWVNLGDSFAGGGKGNYGTGLSTHGGTVAKHCNGNDFRAPGLKPKDLIGIPWRVAFALQADGWYLRSDIIWHKPNPMPESVRDRPTKSHEYVFLLTKRARYYFDQEAVRESNSEGTHANGANGFIGKVLPRKIYEDRNDAGTSCGQNPAGRNLRSVWAITPKPFKGAHFATFPPALVERCVKAGTSERGACPKCSAPWERETETSRVNTRPGHFPKGAPDRKDGGNPFRPETRVSTLGWDPTCSCPAAEPVPCVVLDPFSGAGTVPLVSKQLGRDAIGIDLNPSYNRMARKRIAAV